VKLFWSDLALDRLYQFASTFAPIDTSAAAAWVSGILEVMQRLERFPASGRVVPEAGRKTIREIIHGHLRIIYRVESQRIVVLTVRHTRQLTGPNDIPG